MRWIKFRLEFEGFLYVSRRRRVESDMADHVISHIKHLARVENTSTWWTRLVVPSNQPLGDHQRNFHRNPFKADWAAALSQRKCRLLETFEIHAKATRGREGDRWDSLLRFWPELLDVFDYRTSISTRQVALSFSFSFSNQSQPMKRSSFLKAMAFYNSRLWISLQEEFSVVKAQSTSEVTCHEKSFRFCRFSPVYFGKLNIDNLLH